MATAQDFITDALDMIGVHAAETAIEPEEIKIGLTMFNDYMAEIDEAGTDFGFVPLQNASDEVRLRRGAYRAIKANLAGILSVPFQKPISIELAATIKSANTALGRMTVRLGRVKVASTLPKGSGNAHARSRYDDIFFPEQEKRNF